MLIRFKLDQASHSRICQLQDYYGFDDKVLSRLAIAISLINGDDFFTDTKLKLDNKGLEYTPTSNFFGNTVGGVDNTVLYHAILNQYYERELHEDNSENPNAFKEFTQCLKYHIWKGSKYWLEQLDRGIDHTLFLLNYVTKGLNLKSDISVISNEGVIKEEIQPDVFYTKSLNFSVDKANKYKYIINDLDEGDLGLITIVGQDPEEVSNLLVKILTQFHEQAMDNIHYSCLDAYNSDSSLSSFFKKLSGSIIEHESHTAFNPLKLIDIKSEQLLFIVQEWVSSLLMYTSDVFAKHKNILIDFTIEFLKEYSDIPDFHVFIKSLKNYYNDKGLDEDHVLEFLEELGSYTSTEHREIKNSNRYIKYSRSLKQSIKNTLLYLQVQSLIKEFKSMYLSTVEDSIQPVQQVIIINGFNAILQSVEVRKTIMQELCELRKKGVVILITTTVLNDYYQDPEIYQMFQVPILLKSDDKMTNRCSFFLGVDRYQSKMKRLLPGLDTGKALINWESKPLLVSL